MQNAPPIPYEVPPWAKSPPSDYQYELIKDGRVLSKSPILKDHIVVGKFDNCDLRMEHQSVSRYHAVIQFGNDKSYIFDLGSSNGTFVNKSKIPPRKYVEFRVSDTIKFGESTRKFVLVGPRPKSPIKAKVLPKREIEVSFGFRPDAYEGDCWGGTSIYKLEYTLDRGEIGQDHDYCKDPKKYMLGFCENYKASLKLNTRKEKDFKCELIVEGLKGPFQAQGTGITKILAEKDACLEACAKLDLMDILRDDEGNLNSTVRDLIAQDAEHEQDDYYDRTQANKKLKMEEAETFESLAQKLQDNKLEMRRIQTLLDHESNIC